MAVSVTAESLEIAQKPASITENGDGTVTTEDMKVYAVLKNGEKVDVSKYVTVTADGDVSYKVTYTYGSEIAEDVNTLTASFADDNKAAAKAVDEAVAKLTPVTLESGNAVKAARKAFDALTPAQKKLLDPKTEGKLVAAENEYKVLIKDNADEMAAKEVEDKIARLQPVTKDSGEAIKDARSSYEALTPEQKALVSKDSVAALEKAEKIYNMIIASNKPGTAVGDNTGNTSGSGRYQDYRKRRRQGRTEPEYRRARNEHCPCNARARGSGTCAQKARIIIDLTNASRRKAACTSEILPWLVLRAALQTAKAQNADNI